MSIEKKDSEILHLKHVILLKNQIIALQSKLLERQCEIIEKLENETKDYWETNQYGLSNKDDI